MPHLTPDTVAFLQYTSGSTGDPKGVVVTHGNVLNNEAAMSEALRASAASVLVGWIPHLHDMGLIGQLLAFFNGANLVTMSPLAFLKQPIRLLKAISDYRGTITAAPNFAYDLIARRVTPEQLAGLDLSAWEVALNGAEPVRRRTVERITNAACSGRVHAVGDASRIRHGRGDTDGHRQPRRPAPPRRRRRRPRTEPLHTRRRAAPSAWSSSGEPAPGVEVRIVDPETLNVLPEDEVGEIWLRSASVASGYHNRPAETTERFHAHTSDGEGPFLRTGDLGLLHEGELYVTGRLKDLLIVNGRNLYPQDIEEFVQDVHPAVTGSRGCAISVDVDDAERLVLIQAVKTELLGDMSSDELAAAVKGAVARAFDVPAPAVVFIDRAGIHLTTSGKVQRASMRAAFLKGELTDVVHEEQLT